MRGRQRRKWRAGALLAAAICLTASAQAAAPYPRCVTKKKTGYSEPATLKALLACQERQRARFTQSVKNSPGPAELDGLGEFQRAEVRDYLSRHPGRASTGESEERGGTEDAAGRVPGVKAGAKPASAKPGTELSREALLENEQRLPEELREGYRELHDILWKKSDNGQLGITQGMVQDVLGYLEKSQGGVSVEMRQLLMAVGKDGAILSDETMKLLKKASRDAKSEGLDLGIKPDVEQDILDPKTDPPGPPAGPPVN